MPPQVPRAPRATPPPGKPVTAAAEVIATTEDEDEPPPFFSLETLKGWASSLVLHAILLLVLAFWYFSPQSKPPPAFSTKLAGSESGLEDGLQLKGGLNSEFEIPHAVDAPTPTPTPALASARPTLDAQSLAPKPEIVGGSDRPTIGGGLNNKNPGAGDGDGFGIARFGQGGEKIHGVEVKVGDPQFTLIWDTDADLDLHVVEPGGKEIYWEDPKGKLGGELDVDNTKGFGPENIYWLHETEDGEKVMGTGPPGDYKWFVVYWGGFGGIAKPTRWKVRIKHEGKVTVVNGRFKALNERSKTHTLHVDRTAGSSAADASPAR